MERKEKSIEWTLSSGDTARIVITLQIGREIKCDWGEVIEDAKYADIGVRGETDEMGTVGYCVRKLHEPAGAVVAHIGKLGLTAERHEDYLAARAEIESDERWQAHLSRKAAAEDRARRIDARQAQMRK